MEDNLVDEDLINRVKELGHQPVHKESNAEPTIDRPYFRYTVTRQAFKTLVANIIASMNLKKRKVFTDEAYTALINTADYIRDGTYPFLEYYNEGFYMTCGKRAPGFKKFPISIKFRRNQKRRSRRKI